MIDSGKLGAHETLKILANLVKIILCRKTLSNPSKGLNYE